MSILDAWRSRHRKPRPIEISGDPNHPRAAKSALETEVENLGRDLRARLASVRYQWDQASVEYRQARNKAKGSLRSNPPEIQDKLLLEVVDTSDDMKWLTEVEASIKRLLRDLDHISHYDWFTRVELRLRALPSGTPAADPDVERIRQSQASAYERLKATARRARELLETNQALSRDEAETAWSDPRIGEMRNKLIQELENESRRTRSTD